MLFIRSAVSSDDLLIILLLDLSWNSVCSGGHAGVESIARALRRNNSPLVHLDLSHNRISMESCEAIAHAIQNNHSLLGLHISAGTQINIVFGFDVQNDICPFFHFVDAGNECRVDIHGFIKPFASQGACTNRHVVVANRGLIYDYPDNPRSATTSCWLCGGWQEKQFEFIQKEDPSESNTKRGTKKAPPYSIYLHLYLGDKPLSPIRMQGARAGGCKAHRISAQQERFLVSCMLPPGRYTYYFTMRRRRQGLNFTPAPQSVEKRVDTGRPPPPPPPPPPKWNKNVRQLINIQKLAGALPTPAYKSVDHVTNLKTNDQKLVEMETLVSNVLDNVTKSHATLSQEEIESNFPNEFTPYSELWEYYADEKDILKGCFHDLPVEARNVLYVAKSDWPVSCKLSHPRSKGKFIESGPWNLRSTIFGGRARFSPSRLH